MGLIPLGLLSASMQSQYWISRINLSLDALINANNSNKYFNATTHDIKVDSSNGDIYMSYSFYPDNDTRLSLLSIKSDGSLNWKKVFDNTSNISMSGQYGGIAISSSNYILFSNSYGYIGSGGIRKISKADGSRITDIYIKMQTPTTPATDIYPFVQSLSIDSSDNIYMYLLDWFYSSTTNQIFTAKLNSAYTSSQIYKQPNPNGYGYSNSVLNQAHDVNNNIYSLTDATNADEAISLQKTSSSGVILWRKKIFSSSLSSPSIFTYPTIPIAVDTSGNSYCYVYSYASGMSFWSAYSLVKHDTSGARIWEKKMNIPVGLASDSPGQNTGANMYIDSSNNIYVSTRIVSPNVSTGNDDTASIKIDKYASDGTLLWQRKITGSYIVNSDICGIISYGTYFMLIIRDNIAAVVSVIKLPADGSITGSYDTGSTGTLTYATGTDTITNITTGTSSNFTSDVLSTTSYTMQTATTDWTRNSTSGNSSSLNKITIP